MGKTRMLWASWFVNLWVLRAIPSFHPPLWVTQGCSQKWGQWCHLFFLLSAVPLHSSSFSQCSRFPFFCCHPLVSSDFHFVFFFCFVFQPQLLQLHLPQVNADKTVNLFPLPHTGTLFWGWNPNGSMRRACTRDNSCPKGLGVSVPDNWIQPS